MIFVFQIFTLCSTHSFRSLGRKHSLHVHVTERRSCGCWNKWKRNLLLMQKGWKRIIVLTSHLIPEGKQAAALLHEQKYHPPEATCPQSNTNTKTNTVYQPHPPTGTVHTFGPDKGRSWKTLISIDPVQPTSPLPTSAITIGLNCLEIHVSPAINVSNSTGPHKGLLQLQQLCLVCPCRHHKPRREFDRLSAILSYCLRCLLLSPAM